MGDRSGRRARAAALTTHQIRQYQLARRAAGAATGTINRETSALRGASAARPTRRGDASSIASPSRKVTWRKVREPSRRPGSSLCSGAQAWIQHSAGTCPNSWRDGFARDCPLRHPVAWVLALRVCSGLTAVFLVVFRALSAVTGKAPGKREATEARSRAVSRRSSRKPGFVVRGGRSRDTRPRTADLGSGGGSMEELAPAAVEFEPRMEPAVRKWCELTPWQRRSMTLDDFADPAPPPWCPRTKKRIRDMPGYTEICRDIVGWAPGVSAQ